METNVHAIDLSRWLPHGPMTIQAAKNFDFVDERA